MIFDTYFGIIASKKGGMFKMEAKLLTADRFVDTKIGCSYRYVHSNTEYFRPHYHDYYEIFISLDGEATHLVNEACETLSRGDAVFIRPSDTHDYVCRRGESFDMLNITFTAETADTIFSFLGNGFGRDRLLCATLPPSVKLSESDMESLSSHMAVITATGDPEKLKTALRILIFDILTKHFSGFREKKEGEIPYWLVLLRREMKKKPNFTRGISAISQLCGKSREHVSRSMKRYYGVTVSEFVNDLRLNFVANMLAHSDTAIIDIVFESGFNNVSWASKCFKEKYGISMSEYRKNCGGEAAVLPDGQ